MWPTFVCTCISTSLTHTHTHTHTHTCQSAEAVHTTSTPYPTQSSLYDAPLQLLPVTTLILPLAYCHGHTKLNPKPSVCHAYLRSINRWWTMESRAGTGPSVHRLATGWTVRDSNPATRTKFFPPNSPRFALGPTPPPVQCVPALFPGCKAAGAWRWPPTPI